MAFTASLRLVTLSTVPLLRSTLPKKVSHSMLVAYLGLGALPRDARNSTISSALRVVLASRSRL